MSCQVLTEVMIASAVLFQWDGIGRSFKGQDFKLHLILDMLMREFPDEQTASIVMNAAGWLSSPKLSEKKLLEHCTNKLAKFKVPKELEFISVLPKNPSGKVLKRELRMRPASGQTN